MVSLQKIAEEARLSRASVSQILNKADTRYSPDTRRRVEAIAQRHGYRPNRLVQAILSGRTKSIGVVVHSLSNPVTISYIEVLVKLMRDEGYQMFVVESPDATIREREAIEDLLARRVDGLVVFVEPAGDTSYYRALHAQKIPLVLVGYNTEASHFSWVYVDPELGTYLATRHLLELGHKRIAFALCRYLAAVPGARLAGYQRALDEYKIEYDPNLVLRDLPTAAKTVREFTQVRLQDKKPPTAFLYNDDEMALVGIQTIHEMGLVIPRDISLVGYNNSTFAEHASPALTTVDLPLSEMARVTANILMKRIEDASTDSRKIVCLKPSLVVRRSTAVVRSHERI